MGNINLAAYEYEDNGGNLTEMTYGNDASVSYFYDDLDRLVKTVYNDTARYVEYAYNAESVLAKLTYRNSDGTQIAAYHFEYDSLGRLIRSTQYSADDTITQRTEHLYDEFNRLSSQSWVIEGDPFSERYDYNDPPTDDQNVGADDPVRPKDGSLAQMTTASGATIDYTYDTLKRLHKTTVKDGENTILTNAYSYYNLGTTDGVTQTTTQVKFHNVTADDGTLLTGALYNYDDVGNIVSIYESKLVGTNTSRRPLALYTYDVQNQLTHEVVYTFASGNTSTMPSSIIVYTYTYDTAGNILSETKNRVAYNLDS